MGLLYFLFRISIFVICFFSIIDNNIFAEKRFIKNEKQGKVERRVSVTQLREELIFFLEKLILSLLEENRCIGVMCEMNSKIQNNEHKKVAAYVSCVKKRNIDLHQVNDFLHHETDMNCARTKEHTIKVTTLLIEKEMCALVNLYIDIHKQILSIVHQLLEGEGEHYFLNTKKNKLKEHIISIKRLIVESEKFLNEFQVMILSI